MEIIIAFVGGRDVFVSLPTGYGKSIVYASLPFIFDSIKGNFVLYTLNLHFCFDSDDLFLHRL